VSFPNPHTNFEENAVGAEGKSVAAQVTCQENPPEGWDGYLASHPQGSLYHDSRWAALIQTSFGHKSFFLTLSNTARVRGILPLVHLKSRIFGNALVSMPYFNYGGVLADDAQAAEALVDASLSLSQKLRADYVELRQNEPVPGGWPSKSHKVIMQLALPPDPEELWASFKTKLRTRVRRAEKEGFTVHFGKQDLLDDYYSVFAKNMRDLGTPVYAHGFFQAILDTFPQNAHIVTVRRENQCIAAGFLLSHRKKMEVPWASSLRQFNHLSPNMLLYWSMLKHSIAQGCNVFDFGRSTRDSGTYAFKEQWNATPKPTIWTYPGGDASNLPDHSPQSAKYQWAARVWKRLPLSVTNTCGPWIVRNIP